MDSLHSASLRPIPPATGISLCTWLLKIDLRQRTLWVLFGTLVLMPLSLALAGRMESQPVIVRLTSVLIMGAALMITYSLRSTDLNSHSKVLVVLFGASYLALTSPAFTNMAAWWGVPMDHTQVILGEGQLYLLCGFTVCCALLLNVFRSESKEHRVVPSLVSLSPRARQEVPVDV